MSQPHHGANPHYVYRWLEIEQPNEMIDFSVNLNPLPIYHHVPQFAAYPDPNYEAEHRQLAAYWHRPVERFLLTNGASEAFYLVANVYRDRPLHIVQPAFSEYERAWRAHGGDVYYVTSDIVTGAVHVHEMERALTSGGVVMLANPNNPLGTVISLEQLIGFAELAEQHETLFIVDEAFIQFTEERSLIDVHQLFSHTIVVHSLTKMFQLAGVRLGYMYAAPDVIARLQERQPTWSINALATSLLPNVLQSEAFKRQSRAVIAAERERMKQFWQTFAVVSESKTNYYTVLLDEAERWLRHLAEQGIVVRHTNNFPLLQGRALRIAVRTAVENERLIEVVRRWAN